MGQGISLKSERKPHDLNHDLTFYCIHKSMFRVLGIYNFGGYQEHLQQTSKSDESCSKVASDYSINYGLFSSI